MGRHQYYVPPHDLQEYTKLGFWQWDETFAVLTLTKVSICLLLLRIVISRRFLRPIQALMATLIISTVVQILLYTFQCTPVDAAWNVTKKENSARCFSKRQVEGIIMSQAIISVIADFILAAFPILILYSLQMTFLKKCLLCGLMGLGLITAACTIVRTVMNWQNLAPDGTWYVTVNTMWRTAEVNVGIMAACCPTLVPLFRRLHERVTSRRSSKTKSSVSSPSFFRIESPSFFRRFWHSRRRSSNFDSSTAKSPPPIYEKRGFNDTTPTLPVPVITPPRISQPELAHLPRGVIYKPSVNFERDWEAEVDLPFQTSDSPTEMGSHLDDELEGSSRTRTAKKFEYIV